jgi:hypothetical protein
VYATESVLLARKKTGSGADICAVFLRDAMWPGGSSPRAVLAACAEEAMLLAHQYGRSSPFCETRARGLHRAATKDRREVVNSRTLRGVIRPLAPLVQ